MTSKVFNFEEMQSRHGGRCLLFW